MNPSRRTAMGLFAAATAAPALAQMPPATVWEKEGQIATSAGTLHWVSIGEDREGRAPLVLLHKLGGWVADWRHVAPLLATERRIIAIDLPAHGASKMWGPAPYMVTAPEVMSQVLAAIDELGLSTFHIGGNSLGGITGAMIAALFPDRIKTLTLISASLIGQISRADIAQQDIDRPKQGLSDGVLSVSIHGTMVQQVIDEQIAAREAVGPWMRPIERGVGWANVNAFLPRIKAPTLSINADRGNYAKYVEIAKRLIPNNKSIIIPNSGSFVHQERPAEVAAAINQFLA
jgi:pimeloyl-ACP methyl ester carboxylesterase